MALRVEAFRNVSEAIRLDSSGEKEVAFLKYLQSIQILCAYINDQYESVGPTKLVADAEESKQVLSVIKECTERMNFILCAPDTPESEFTASAPTYEEIFGNCISNGSASTLNFNRKTSKNQEGYIHADVKETAATTEQSQLSENLKRRNAQLFKIFQQRIENAKDERMKINLKLELHRRLAENRMLAIKKQAEMVRQQQEKNKLALEKADRARAETLPLSEREQEKRKIFDLVLQYDSTQVSPVQTKFITSDSLNSENTRRLFESTIQIKDHPITVWLIRAQTNVRFEIENALREYSHLADLLPDKIPETGNGLYPLTLLESSKRGVDPKNIDDVNIHAILSSLSDCLGISSNIKIAIDDILEVFCLAYKSLLPEDARGPCYRAIEISLLQPLWPSLTLLFRMKNSPCERRIAETIINHLNSSPEEFGVSSNLSPNSEAIYSYAVHQLKLLLTMPSLVDKISTLVQVSQKLCGEQIDESEDDGSMHSQLLGADDLICRLCYVIVQARIPQLVSECNVLEQLMDQKYMLGEEGYSLTSFQTALKYLEMKKLIDAEGASTAGSDE